MEFLSGLLHKFGMGDKTLGDAASKAYDQSLRRHHGMLARHIFSVSGTKILNLIRLVLYLLVCSSRSA
jgi:hypothetical protein